MRSSIRLFICLLALAFPMNAGAQQTVGNGTVIAPSSGQREGYGLNMLMTTTDSTYLTRHHRRMDDTGIGSSFLGTTSPTSESSPAVRSISAPLVQSSTYHLDSGPTFRFSNSPALAGPLSYSAEAPNTVQIDSSFHFSNFRRGGDSAVQQIPSFNARPSFMNQMQFGTGGYGFDSKSGTQFGF